MTSPAIRCAKQQLDAEIHFLTKKQFQNVLEPNPYIDKLWTIDQEINEIIGPLKQQKFTHIIDLHKNLRSFRLKLALQGPKKLTYPKGTWNKYARIYFKKTPNPRHVVDRYLQPLQPLGIENDGSGLDFFIPEDISLDWSHLGILPGKYIAFVIGAAHFTKRLPQEKIRTICSGIKDPIVLIGGPDVAPMGAAIADELDHVINLAGEMSFMESAKIIEQAKAVIAHDTGFMHISAALGKPLISIWGSTDPNLGFWPYFGQHPPGLNHIEEVNGLGCRPCSKFGRATCPKGHFKCMRDIDEQQIIQIINCTDL